jgi:hypothetical protein
MQNLVYSNGNTAIGISQSVSPLFSSGSNDAYGEDNNVNPTGTGTGYGTYNDVVNSAGTGSYNYGYFTNVSGATENYGLRANVNTGTNNYGVYVYPYGGTNAYGFYANVLGATNNWGVYATADKNYFSGKVGIGTVIPDVPLVVSGAGNDAYNAGYQAKFLSSARAKVIIGAGSGGSELFLGHSDNAAGWLLVSNYSDGKFVLQEATGTTWGDQCMTINSSHQTAFPFSQYEGLSGGTVMYIKGGIIGINASSRRLKENIRLSSLEELNKVLSLEVRDFDWKESKEEDIGLIAEEVDELGLKHLVTYDKENNPLGVKYEKLSVYLLGVVKEQQKEIEEQKKLNEEQKKLNEELKLRLDNIEKNMQPAVGR